MTLRMLHDEKKRDLRFDVDFARGGIAVAVSGTCCMVCRLGSEKQASNPVVGASLSCRLVAEMASRSAN